MIVIAFVAISSTQSSEIPIMQSNLAKETGEDFSSSINLAVSAGKGFSYSFTFPKTILNDGYEIIFDTLNNRIIMNWTNGANKFNYAYPITAYNYRLGGCLNNIDKKLESTKCKNIIKLYNDGQSVTIMQED